MTAQRKRQRGSGSIFRKKPCRKWVIQYYQNGKQVKEYTGTTEWAEAAKLLRQRLHEADSGLRARQGKPPRVEELFSALEAHNTINRRNAYEVRKHWRHLKPVFGAVRADQLSTDDIRRYTLMRKEGEAADATVNRELATLRRMFKLAKQSTPPRFRGDIPHIPMLKEDNVRTNFVEDADYERLVAEAEELWLRTFLELAYSYGWRKSELLGLRVRQVDLRARTIRLDPGMTKNRDGREVAMTSKVAALLREAIAGKGPEDLVLTRADGLPVRDFRKTWRELTRRAGLPHLLVHDLRRSAAKALRAAGVPESVVMSIGGWKTAAMFRRYAIVSQTDQRAAVEKLERARAENSPFSTPFRPEATPQPVPTGSGKVQ